MALVDYSDSEGSDNEQPTAPPKAAAKPVNNKFSIDKANPQKIRVKLSDATPTNGTHEDEPAPKRARMGGGFSGFNAMLPPPKRTAEKPQTSKAPARKVFSLKTGAEPGFSRESDAEMRQLFADQDDGTGNDEEVSLPEVPKRTQTAEQTTKGNAFMFKPLSVARNPDKKKKTTSTTTNGRGTSTLEPSQPSKPPPTTTAPPPKKKMSLFSAHTDADIEPTAPDPDPTRTSHTDVTADYDSVTTHDPSTTAPSHKTAQSLTTVATDLNLSAAERRQLFGRSGVPNQNASAASVINFNTDAEYAANEALRATGETVQHNPVRPIASGKHSLRQLVSSAQGQKEALEESFAAGKRNRKEAGSKYGW